jgi:peptidoglycan/LPS O-acetylase OafA/YrhL
MLESPDPAIGSAPARLRYESLDHWRGLACLLVIVYHSTIMYGSLQSPAGASAGHPVAEWLLAQTHTFSVGVALFFVISGYCISAAADTVRRKGYGVQQYFWRRFRRIYPPFWIILVLSVAFFLAVDYWPLSGLLSNRPWAQPRPFWYSPTEWLGNITLTETWRYHVFGSPRAHIPGQAWTLCYEEQFYLVMGLLLACVPRAFFAAVAGITILTLTLVCGQQIVPLPIEGFFFDGSWLLFAVGVAVYYRVNYAVGWRSRAVDLVLLSSVPLSWFIHVPIYGATVGFAFAALLPFFYALDRRIAAAKTLRPLLVCGQMCYSLYLVHQLPVKAVSTGLYALGLSSAWSTVFVTIPACVGVSVMLGWLFHTTVERHFLNATYQLRSRVRPAARPVTALPDVI